MTEYSSTVYSTVNKHMDRVTLAGFENRKKKEGLLIRFRKRSGSANPRSMSEGNKNSPKTLQGKQIAYRNPVAALPHTYPV